MPTHDPPIPLRHEIELQLETMRATQRFLNAENQSDFLALAVRLTLDGRMPTEDALGKKLFGPKYRKDESTDVRVTASNLRKALDNYYKNEGREDKVIIALPAAPTDRRLKLPRGEAYKPFFSV